MPSLSIKAQRVQNLSDARYFAAMGVEWMSFLLDPGHPEALSPQVMQAIRAWLSGPRIVGEFGLGQSLEEIEAACTHLDLAGVQLSPFAPLAILQALEGKGILRFQELVLETWANLPQALALAQTRQAHCEYFVLNGRANNLKLQQMDASSLALLAQLGQLKPLFLALSWGEVNEDLTLLQSLAQVQGICLQGGEEERPGYKSFEALEPWFEWLDEAGFLGA